MDNAVALVQAYLRLNGYFTVTEYPVIATRRDGTYRTATDLDVLAFRFPKQVDSSQGVVLVAMRTSLPSTMRWRLAPSTRTC